MNGNRTSGEDGTKLKRRIDCAMKREPCDLVMKNVRIFNVFTGEIQSGEIAVTDGTIAAIGTGYRGKTEVDGKGRIALPGLIDSHIHVESSMLTPEEFALAAVPHGTTGIVCDPHEIVNVCGVEGAEYMKEAFSRLSCEGVNPLDAYVQLPSSVPATPFETSGAKIDGKETEREIGRDLFFGLGEVMNDPAVLAGDEDTLQKIAAAHLRQKPVDGHAPALFGDGLNAYAAAGICTDHECGSREECLEKIAKGLYVQLRNGSSAQNLTENAQAVNAYNYRRFLLCSDDRHADDLIERGHMDEALSRLVGAGIPAAWAICMATLNVAECYRLAHKGAIAPSYDADLILVDDLVRFRVFATFKGGVCTSEGGRARFSAAEKYLPAAVKSSVKIKPVTAEHFRFALQSNRARAIFVTPHAITTEEKTVDVTCENGDVRLEGGLNKLAVVERHFASGNIGLALVYGYGLKGGAIGISVSHDSHNLVVLGDDNGAMARVCVLIEQAGGGMAYAKTTGEEAVFPLEIAGLMSAKSAQEVAQNTARLAKAAHEMGVKEEYEPFMTLSFLALPVIPALRLTDRGLFDVTKFRFTTTEAET